jgi:hypothetical protein
MPIDAQTFKNTADELEQLSGEEGFKMPKLIYPEAYRPKAFRVENLNANGWGDRADLIGTHYYPGSRNRDRLERLADAAGDRPLWHTELHSSSGDFRGLVNTMMVLFDTFDLDFTGYSWWGAGALLDPSSNNLKNTVANVAGQSRVIGVEDFDGRELKFDKMNTRTHYKDGTVYVWVTNGKDEPIDANGFRIENGTLGAGDVTYQVYESGGFSSEKKASKTSDRAFQIGSAIPARSVLLVRAPVKEGA